MPSTVEGVDAGTILLVISVVLTVFVVLTTATRLIVRVQRNGLGWDDYTITATAALSIGRTVIQIVSIVRGNGKHHWQLSTTNYEYVLFTGWLTQLFLFPMLALLKISICLLVLRIKNPPKLKYFLWGVITGLVLTNLLPFIVLLAECSPVNAYWTSQSADCWDPNVRIYSIYLQTAYSVVTDLLCSLLPIYVVWDLKMPLQRKVGIWALMSLGLISTAFALLRASSLGLQTSDLSWEYCWTAIWADIEVYVGIIATNLSLSRMYYGWFKDVTRSWLGRPESPDEYVEDRPYPMSPFQSSKNSQTVHVRGRRSRRDSHTPSDESKAPLDEEWAIRREVQYSVTGEPRELAIDDIESGENCASSRESVTALPQNDPR